MPKVRVHGFGVSVDGYSAGPNQDLQHPLGVGAEKIFEWFFPTHVFQSMHGSGEGEKGVDNDIAAKGFENVGAWILGRNMFGPIRGKWPDENWKGWWGDEPPYHVPAFVLTHYPREPIVMKGGTTFYFVTDGIHSALEQAKAAAGAKDVRIGGGVSTVRAYLREGLIDEMHLAVGRVLMGNGEHLFRDMDLPVLGYQVEKTVIGERATHVLIRKAAVR
jgi:dihydrofolate reductase